MPGRFFTKKKEEYTPRARAKGASGFGAPLHYSWGYRELPGAGAGQYAFETLALPRYPVVGTGVAVQGAWDYTQGVVYALQGVNLEAIGAPGVKTGGFYAAPLTDTQPTDLSPATVAALTMRQNYMMPGDRR